LLIAFCPTQGLSPTGRDAICWTHWLIGHMPQDPTALAELRTMIAELKRIEDSKLGAH
jgi:hypothetical protein